MPHEPSTVAISAPPTCRPRWPEALTGLALFVATLLAYLPCFRGGLLIDDASHITAPTLRSFSGLWTIWTQPGATHQYYPVLHTAFWLEYKLWADSVLGYHLVNILLHAGSACVLVALLRRLALPGAWFAGFLFALHPVAVESVAWISEQKNTLSTFLSLVALLYYLNFDRRRHGKDYFLATLFFILSVLSKTATITIPAVCLVITWWIHGRLSWKRHILPVLPWIVFGIAVALPVSAIERRHCAAFAPDFSMPLIERVLLAGRALWFYGEKLVWPFDLTFIYPRWTPDRNPPSHYFFPVSVLLLGIVLIAWARKRRGPLASFLIYAGTLFPVLGFIDVFWFVLSYFGDHLQYLSSIALLSAFAAFTTKCAAERSTSIRTGLHLAGAILLGGLGVLTWNQAHLYRDAETLYRATLARNPTAWMAHYNLGEVLNREPGREAEVLSEWETTLRLRPDFAEGHNTLAWLLAKNPARNREAIAHFQKALELKPDFAEAHGNLACLLATDSSMVSQALQHYEIALRLDPSSPEVQNNFGNLLVDLPERQAEGIAHIHEAIRLQPDYAEAHWNLALALAELPNRTSEALEHLDLATRLKPGFEGAADLRQHLVELQRTPPAAP